MREITYSQNKFLPDIANNKSVGLSSLRRNFLRA